MSLSKFPIQKIPLLPLEKIYENLQFDDFLNLSQCSKRMKNCLVSLERTSRNEVTCRVTILADERQIQLKRKGWENFAISSQDASRYPTMDPNTLIDRAIDGTTYTFSLCRWTDRWIEWGINDEHFLSWVRYFRNVFNCRIARLELPLGETISSMNFERLFVQTEILRKADVITVARREIREEELSFILDNFEAEILEIKGPTRHRYRHPSVISRFRQIHLPRAVWLTFDDLWAMIESGTCKKMSFGCLEVTNVLINEFLKKWLNSDNRTLEALLLTHSSWKSLQYDNIFNGIDTLPGAEKRLEAAEHHNDIFVINAAYKRGFDIKRGDGVLATVNIVNDYYRAGFYFTVWYNPNPNV